jgi:hypothetical protein
MERPQQKAWMRGLIDLHKVKKKKNASAMQMSRRRQPRAFTAEYHLKTTASSHKRHRVCLKAFIGILGIGGKQVKNLNKYSWANKDGPIVPVDLRGKHDSRPNRIPKDVVVQIDAHIKSFPREGSHYALKTSTKFLAADLSVRKMHQLYLEIYEPHIRIPLSDGSGSDSDAGDGEDQLLAQKPQVTYDFYLEAFRKFDLAFGKPVVDSCSTCDELKLKIASADDEDVATALRAERKEHLLEADRGYAMRRHDQDLARQCRASDKKWVCPAAEHRSWDATEFICSDMAGVLQTPKVPTNKAFYLRKLKTYCYGNMCLSLSLSLSL